MGVRRQNQVTMIWLTERTLRGAALAMAAVLVLADPALATDKEPLRVGMAVALTGFLAIPDGQFVEGVKLAVEEADKAGGIDGHPIDLHVIDDASNAAVGVTATNQLINQFEIGVMLNGLSSAQNAAILPIVTRAQIPMIITSQLPSGDRTWVFLVTATSEDFADIQLRFAAEHLKAKKIAVVFSQTPYGQIGAKLLAAGAARYGLAVVASEGVEGSSTDMTPLLAKMKAAGADAIVDVLTGSTHIVEAKSASIVGLGLPLVMAGDDLPVLRQAASSYPNLYFIAEPPQAYPHIPDPATKSAFESFLASWKAAGRDPARITSTTAFGWDAAHMLMAGVRASGAVRGEALRGALETLKYQGTSTLYTFTKDDHTGQAGAPTRLQMGGIVNGAVEIAFTPQ
jgi:branched-chain amino acid transport system substrate-binding protein